MRALFNGELSHIYIMRLTLHPGVSICASSIVGTEEITGVTLL